MSVFLAQSLLFLLALASPRLTGVLHVLFVSSLSLQSLAWVVLPLCPGFRGEGAGSLLLLGLKASLFQPSKREHNRIGNLLDPVGRSGFTWPSRPHVVCNVSGCSSQLDIA